MVRHRLSVSVAWSFPAKTGFAPRRKGTLRRKADLGRPPIHRQSDREAASFAGSARYAHVSAVSLNSGLHQCKAEAGAVHAVLMTAPAAIEAIEDSLRIVAMNADTFVAYFYTNVTIVESSRNTDA